MPTGKVKFYDISKSFGFITSDEPAKDGKDIFVHFRELKESGLDFLEEHQKVSYDLKEIKGKVVASNIRLLLP